MQHPVTTNICRPVPVHPTAIKRGFAETDVLSSRSLANTVQDKIFMTIDFKQAGNIVFLSAFFIVKTEATQKAWPLNQKMFIVKK